MNYALYKLPEGFIITSDEEIKENDYCINLVTNEFFQVNDINLVIGSNKNPNDEKVIAQQPQIDFSALTEEEQKRIGWIDIEKLASKEYSPNIYNSYAIDGYKKSFQKAQELLSDKRFTLEDMKRCFEVGKSHGSIYQGNNFERFIQSLSQQSWNVEIQHVCEGIKTEGASCSKNNKCTYPDCGTVKILKLL